MDCAVVAINGMTLPIEFFGAQAKAWAFLNSFTFNVNNRAPGVLIN